MRPRSLIALFVVVAGLCAWSSLFRVEEGQLALVMRFGDPRSTLDEAGLHLKWPAPVDAVVRIDGRTQLLDPAPSEYLTRDKKNVIVDAFLAWRVVDPLLYYKSVSDQAGAEARLGDVLRSVLGNVLAGYDFDQIVGLDGDASLERVDQALTAAAAERSESTFGIRVAAVRIQRLNFPAQNKSAVFRRMEAEREREANAFRAEGAAEYARIKAETDREEAEILAAARLEARRILGEAEAEAAAIAQQSIAQDPELYRFLRSLEVLEGALDERSLLILDGDHELAELFSMPRAPAPRAGDDAADAGRDGDQ